MAIVNLPQDGDVQDARAAASAVDGNALHRLRQQRGVAKELTAAGRYGFGKGKRNHGLYFLKESSTMRSQSEG